MPELGNISLLPAAEADFEQLVALRIEAMRESLERIGRFDPVRARERFRARFSPAHTRYIVIDADRVGLIVVKRAADHLLLDHLYIRPDFQRRGIGGAVLAKVFADADSLNLPVRVGALRESDSNRFYVRHGFRKIAEEGRDIYYCRECRK
jgi:GNAT superfamily N-acetyltransferase